SPADRGRHVAQCGGAHRAARHPCGASSGCGAGRTRARACRSRCGGGAGVAGAARLNPERWERMLRDVTTVHGVRGALVISADDGLVIHQAAAEGLETSDVAALASALVRRSESLATSLNGDTVRLCTLV